MFSTHTENNRNDAISATFQSADRVLAIVITADLKKLEHERLERLTVTALAANGHLASSKEGLRSITRAINRHFRDTHHPRKLLGGSLAAITCTSNEVTAVTLGDIRVVLQQPNAPIMQTNTHTHGETTNKKDSPRHANTTTLATRMSRWVGGDHQEDMCTWNVAGQYSAHILCSEAHFGRRAPACFEDTGLNSVRLRVEKNNLSGSSVAP